MADNSVVQTIKDAEIDARSLSEFLTKSASFMVTRRLAPKVHTLEYYLSNFDLAAAKGDAVVNRADAIISDTQDRANNAINQITADGTAQIAIAISNAGFIPVGTFAGGATLSKPNDVLKASDGKLYRWGGSLPKTVSASSTPESTGGFGSNAWLEVSDASLTQKLAGLGGASTIGSGVSVFNNMAEFLAAESQIQDGSKVFLASLYQGLDLEGEGRLYTYSKSNPKEVGLETGSGYLSRDYDGKVFIAEFGATGSDVDSDTQALRDVFELMREHDGGILSMGVQCEYTLNGTIVANLSNLDWQFNGTLVNIGSVAVMWQPNAMGFGNYNNVRLSKAILKHKKGLVTLADGHSVGSFHMGMCKIDNVVVEDCEFIETIYSGHILDLMGCRYVIFRNNKVLGSTIADRTFVEAVQTSRAWLNSWGNTPIDEWRKQYFDMLATRDVLFENNIIKPYTDPETNETTYPPRPIGDHTYTGCVNIVVKNNYIENVILLTSTQYSGGTPIVQLYGYHLTFEGNTVISNNGNTEILKMEGYNTVQESTGEQGLYRIANNTFEISNTTLYHSVTWRSMIQFITTPTSPYTGENQSAGCKYEFVGNTVDFDVTAMQTGLDSTWFGIHLDLTAKKSILDFRDNNLKMRGAISTIVGVNKGTGDGTNRHGSSLSFVNNIFDCDIRGYAIHVDRNTYDDNGANGTAVTIKGNTFSNMYKAVWINTHGKGVVAHNYFDGWRDRPYGSTEVGNASNYINFTYAYPIILVGNYGTNLPHDNPEMIKFYSTYQPVYNPTQLFIRDYPSKPFNEG